VHGARTAYDHLLSLAVSNGIRRSRVPEVLGLAGLDSVAGKRIRGFSLGMKHRLGIAAALLGEPPVLILDEPVNGLGSGSGRDGVGDDRVRADRRHRGHESGPHSWPVRC
jgi:ABC-type multidrug transport system ATPase subunit